MAVRISNLKPTFTVPAALYLAGDGGQYEVVKFEVQFKRQPTGERDALNAKYLKGEIKLSELLDEIVVGWSGFADESGQPVPYSHAERRAAEADYSGVEQAMAVSWFDHAFIHQRDAAVKKLQGAVAHYLGADNADRYVVDEALQADCAVLGLDVDQLVPQYLQQDRPQDFELWPEHARAWMVYTLCRTQWRKQPVWTGGPMGGGALVWLWEGLDYAAVEILMRRYRVPESEQDEVFEQLQILEGATLEIVNAR